MENNSALVCVCIPVYNGAKTIALTLDSILAQSYPNFEIWVCNNMSTDNTLDIVNEYKENAHCKFTILENPNKGTAEDNWNFMLNNLETEAEIITLYHADDIYDKNIIKEQVEYLSSNDLKATFTLCRLIDEHGTDITLRNNYNPSLPDKINTPIFDFEQLFKYILEFRNFFITPTFMFKKEILKNINPLFDNKNSRSSSDLDTWLRISKQYKIGILPKTLLNYRISSSQGSFIIKQGRTEAADFFRVVDNHLMTINDLSPFKNELKHYNILKSVDLIICAVNMLKSDKTTELKATLKSAINLQNSNILKRKKYIRIHAYAIVTLLLMNLNQKNLCVKIARKIQLG